MKPAAFLRNPNVRLALAWLLPFAACLLQWFFWPQMGLPRWILFYPVAFFAPLVGGLPGGIGATLISTLLAWYFFLPPQLSWQLAEPGSPLAILVFIASGIAFSFFHQRLSDREQKYRTLFNQAGDGIVLTDSQGHFVDVNPTACAMLGKSRAEVVGAHVKDMFPDFTVESWTATGARLKAAGWATFERQLRRCDGSHLTVEVTVSLLHGGYRLAVWRDVEERKRLESALHASEERLRYALDAANEGIWDWNSVNGELFVNDQWLVQFGYTPGAIQPTAELWRSAIHPDDSPTAWDALDGYLAGRYGAYVEEYRVITKSGEIRWHRTTGKIVARDANGRSVRVVGTNTDITERKLAEQQLQENNLELEQQVAARTADLQATVAELHHANAGKDAFLAAVSHELRTPLTGILSMSELLQSGIRGPLTPSQSRYVASIHESGQRLLATVNSVLLYTNLMTGSTPLQREACRLNELCTVAVHSIKPRAAAKQLHITQKVSHIDLQIVSDPQAIIQVLKELLDNAVKFTPNGGRIDLTVTGETVAGETVIGHSAAAAVRIVVADTGIGMSDEQLSALFRPFTQGDQTLARRFEGLGLGLAYVHEMVVRLGGSVSTASEIGRGSSFTVILPARPPQ